MSKQRIIAALAAAGIQVNGDRPWDIQVRDERFYNKVLVHGSLGLGESYMDGWWECEALDTFFYHLLCQGLDEKYSITPRAIFDYFAAVLANLQSPSKVTGSISHHYDIGNDLYKAMLDKDMVYTCAWWENAGNINEAQQAKLDMVCRKLGLKAGQRILDIGCGWGGFAKYAAERFGVSVVGITLSKPQADYAEIICRGLPVEIKLQDFRRISGKFDHIVSLGMIEHVGYKNYRKFMDLVSRHLSDDGIFLLQTIGRNTSSRTIDPWVGKYIFPNSMIPSIKQLGRAMEGNFVMEDWHNFGVHYDKTLMAWFHNLQHHWHDLKDRYSERFYRTWKYYLLSCAGAFRARNLQLWQIVLTKKGLRGGFKADRYEVYHTLGQFLKRQSYVNLN